MVMYSYCECSRESLRGKREQKSEHRMKKLAELTEECPLRRRMQNYEELNIMTRLR